MKLPAALLKSKINSTTGEIKKAAAKPPELDAAAFEFLWIDFI